MYDPATVKSKSRFVIALRLAALMGGALVWLAIGGSLETYASPSQINLADGQTYRLNAVVASGSPSDAARQALSPSGVSFQVQDKDDPTKTVKVVYKGLVPETVQDGREIVVTGHMVNGEFVGKRDSLLAKCPSKFSSQNSA